ncbi:MAG: tectonin domain-containing protein, partial [Vulcanimicrobiaceae bacterium]
MSTLLGLARNRRFGSALGALAVAILAAGCSSAGSGLHTPPPASQMGMPKSVSPALIHVAPMARTATQSRSAMHSPPRTAIDITGPNWTEIPGAATQVAAAADGSIWVLSTAPSGPDKYIWHYVSGTWTNIAGLASQIAVAPDGTLYAINSGGGTYAYSGGSWTALGGGASWITTAADGSIYVLSNGGTAGSDQAIWHNVGGAWSQVPGSGTALAGWFDTGSYTLPGGTVAPSGLYIVNSRGAIYYENANQSFATLPANVSALAPTQSGGVFGLGYPANSGGNTIYYYNLDSPGWTAQSGAGVSLS